VKPTRLGFYPFGVIWFLNQTCTTRTRKLG